MNKTNRKYIAILIVLIVIFVIIRSNDKTEKIISFFDVDSVDVAAIEISDAADTLKLVFRNNAWMITEPLQYEADENRVKTFFDKVLRAETSSLPISESESSFETYELTDSLATRIKIYDKKDKLLADAYLGKMKGQANTPARKHDSSKVYRLNEMISSYYVRPDAQNWRQKQVAAIEKEAIEKISVLYGNEGYELTRTDSLWLFEDGTNSLTVAEDNAALKMIFSGLKRIQSSQFKDFEWEKYENKLAAPELEIGVNLLDGSAVYMRLAKDDEKNYVMQKDNMTDHLFVQHESWAKRFMKAAGDFEEK